MGGVNKLLNPPRRPSVKFIARVPGAYRSDAAYSQELRVATLRPL